MADIEAQLADAVRTANRFRQSVAIRGGGSKVSLLGLACSGVELDLTAHRGIVDYQPNELVVTVRAGTPVAELEETLAAAGQRLGSEPPAFAGRATVGGSVACGLSGPARPWAGSVRDQILGLRMINGEGAVLNFGGTVMKNVAGYDISRLQAGARGTLGVITAVSLRTTPRAADEITIGQDLAPATALARMLDASRSGGCLSGAAWLGGRLYLRLSGAEAAVAAACADLGGDLVAGNETPWERLAHMEPAGAGAPLWRLCVAPATPLDTVPVAPAALDWGGSLRYYPGDCAAEMIATAARRGRGFAWRINPDAGAETLPAPSPPLARMLSRVRDALDARAVFNHGLATGGW